MVGDISIAENIYIACGKTDMRKSIDGLAAMVQSQYHLDPFTGSIFLFCGGKSDRIKILLWEGDGFVLLYKRLESGRFRWPRKRVDCKSTIVCSQRSPQGWASMMLNDEVSSNAITKRVTKHYTVLINPKT